MSWQHIKRAHQERGTGTANLAEEKNQPIKTKTVTDSEQIQCLAKEVFDEAGRRDSRCKPRRKINKPAEGKERGKDGGGN